jgi:adenosylmethionine-8-amino-7-oxononanoate aminotransferase
MASTEADHVGVALDATAIQEQQRLAREHLWLHFSAMGHYREDEIPVIVRGDGPYVWDANGKRYLDFFAGLITVQIGYGHGEEIGQAVLEQLRELPYYSNWTFAHPPAIRLAAKLAELAPPGMNRAFFVSGGGDANESVIKLARQYHALRGEPGRRKVIARKSAYHGTTYGALSLTGIGAIRAAFEPLMPGVRHVANTNRYRCKYCACETACTLSCAEEVAEAIEFEGPETVSMVIMEPVQNVGGALTPDPAYHARVREICDHYGVLLVADEVICGFGRLGEWFGCQRYDYVPDIISCAKGLSSGYAPLGAVILSDKVAEPFVDGNETYLHGITFGGHPMATAAALKNIEIMERLDLLGNVRRNEAYFGEQVRGLQERHEIIGDVRGAGYFWALELVKDRTTKASFEADEQDRLLKGLLTPELFAAGLICRADDRADPVVQLTPPLIVGREHIDEAIGILDSVLPRLSVELSRS